jgi:hypothetical protein
MGIPGDQPQARHRRLPNRHIEPSDQVTEKGPVQQMRPADREAVTEPARPIFTPEYTQGIEPQEETLPPAVCHSAPNSPCSGGI